MSDKFKREWHFYIEDMIFFCEKIAAYTDGMRAEDFIHSDAVYDATLRNIELIGEAATHIPEDIRNKLSMEIPWRQIIATRNILIHAYLGIDDEVIWDIIENEIPNLIDKLKKIRSVLNYNFE